MDLRRMEVIIEESTRIPGFNKEILDFLIVESSGCILDSNNFSRAVYLLRDEVPCAHVKLLCQIRAYVSGYISSDFETRILDLLRDGPVEVEDLSFLAEGHYSADHLHAFLEAFKNRVPRSKINMLKNDHIHPIAVERFIHSPERITSERIKRIEELHEFQYLSNDHMYDIIDAIIFHDFTDKQIKALIDTEHYSSLQKFFEAGLTDAYIDSFEMLNGSVYKSEIIDALKEKIEPAVIIDTVRRDDHLELTRMVQKARKKRVNSEFNALLKRYS